MRVTSFVVSLSYFYLLKILLIYCSLFVYSLLSCFLDFNNFLSFYFTSLYFPSHLCLLLVFENRTAAEAALARIQCQKKNSTTFNTSLAAIRAQVQRELEAEKKAKAAAEQQARTSDAPKVLTDENNKNLAAQGVYFRFVN